MSPGGDEKWWSVKLRIKEGDLNKMSSLWAPDFVEARHIQFGGSNSDPEADPPSLTFELLAADFTQARERAQTAVHRMRRALKLPDAVSPVVWLAPIGEDDASSRFLDQARDLISEESYGLAVVAAQIHFEVQLRALLIEAAGEDPPRWAKRLLAERTVAELRRDSSLAAVELLLGVDVTQLPEWPAFRNHLERRNDVAHRGQAVEKEHAEASLRVVKGLWVNLAEAAREQG